MAPRKPSEAVAEQSARGLQAVIAEAMRQANRDGKAAEHALLHACDVSLGTLRRAATAAIAALPEGEAVSAMSDLLSKL